MTIAQILEKMIAYSGGNLHDINHLICVWTYAKTIGELEGLEQETQTTLEIAAITHDIACPLCRQKYGNANGKYQELESPPLVEDFFAGMPVERDMAERISWLVAHHHTYTHVDGLDYQILLEADFLVNADEGGLVRAAIENMRQSVFRTGAGIRLLDSIYLREQ